MRTETGNQKTLFRLAKAAEQLQISPHTLRTWCKTGIVSYHRMGNLIMVDQTEICRVIQQSAKANPKKSEVEIQPETHPEPSDLEDLFAVIKEAISEAYRRGQKSGNDA